MLAFRRFLPSPRNAIALGCGFLLAFLLWWWTSRARPTSAPPPFAPAGEMDRIEYAVANARSWRATTIGTLHGQPFQTDQEVVCPFDSHTVTRVPGAAGANAVVDEFIETQDTLYAREGGQPWRSRPNAPMDKCRAGPMAGPASLIDTLESLKGATKLRRGAALQFDGGSCRLWDFLGSGAGAPLGSICTDEVTRLPLELRLGSLHVQYSRWNQPAAITPPQLH